MAKRGPKKGSSQKSHNRTYGKPGGFRTTSKKCGGGGKWK